MTDAVRKITVSNRSRTQGKRVRTPTDSADHGFIPVQLLEAEYNLDADAPFWLLKKMSDGCWLAHLPAQTVQGQEVFHRHRFTATVFSGPTSKHEDWLVVTLQGYAALVRTVDLSEFPPVRSRSR
jgi:hypothetical protein